MWTLSIALAADFILNLASGSEEESSNDDEEIIATLATVIVRKKYKTKPARVQNYLDTVSNYNVKQFQQHFRIIILST
jgi:ADP-ribosylglycohydrolase